MSGLEMHVIANGDLFRETFNAVVTVLGTSTFATALRLALLFSILGAAVSYVKGHDLLILAKWFMLYFVVTVILLGPKVDLHIIDSSNQGAVYDVQHVPYGLAFPASMITSISYGLESTMEEAFAMPDDASYAKSGLLFGSKIFELSTGFHIVDPKVKSDFNEYVKNCVLGDVLINQKYSMKTLADSNDIWSTISSNPSPIRGILFQDGFKTCQSALGEIKNAITQEVQNNSFTFFGVRIFGGNASIAAHNLQEALANAYQYYAGLSQSAEQIMTQNVLINGIREGVLNYATESQATAALVNLASTQAMERTRMAWATSRNLAVYVLPLMQTDILLMLLCLFPLIILITIQPGFGYKIFKSYVYSLIWVESWPLLFSVLNLAATFYLVNKTSSLADGGLTLSNSNQLALEHSDVANMAGYLMTCVPFLAIGIVKGMDSAFSSAAQYIGGMLHSTAAAAATEVVTGNISLGNASYNNVNANKFDTNASYMHGMATKQLPNAALVTHTASGHDVWNAGSAISNLATNFQTGSMISSSLSHQAELSKSAALQSQLSYNHSISDAASKLENFSKTQGMHQGMSDNYSTQETASASQHASDMYSVVQNVAERNGVSWNEAFKSLATLSQHGDVHGTINTPAGKLGPGGVGANVDISFNHARSSDEVTGHNMDVGLNVSHEDLHKFSSDMNYIAQSSTLHSADTSHSLAVSQLSQLATDFREAESAAANYSSSLTTADRLSNLASYAEQHSAQFNSNCNQILAEYVQREVPDRAAYLLSNPNNPRAIAELEVYASRLAHSPDFANRLDGLYEQGASAVNPSRTYQSGNASMTSEIGKIPSGYQNQSKQTLDQAKAAGANFDAAKHSGVVGNATAQLRDKQDELIKDGIYTKDAYTSEIGKTKARINEASKIADRSAFNFAPIKPKFVEKDGG